MQKSGDRSTLGQVTAKKDRTTPRYVVTSVDRALRLAAILQLEGALTVSEAAARLSVAPSTAHRLLATLVHRDFATHDEGSEYRVGPALALAAAAPSQVAALRGAALEPLSDLVDALGETASLVVRTDDTVRFIASVESDRALRVGSREGLVFPAHVVTGGLVLLACLPDGELGELYAPERYAHRPTARPDLRALRKELARIRRTGYAVNLERSEQGVAAVGKVVVDERSQPVAGIAISLPSARYSAALLPRFDEALGSASDRITAALRGRARERRGAAPPR